MLNKEVKNFAKSFIKFYKFKNYYLDNERFDILDITREINKIAELNDYDMQQLDDFIRAEIIK